MLLGITFVALLSQLAVSPASKVTDVTVHQGSARITRTARLDLTQGDMIVRLDGLPEGLTEDSLKIEGGGAAKAKVFGATVDRITRNETARPEAKVAQDKLTALERQDKRLAGQLNVAEARRVFVDSLRATYSEERSKNLPLRAADVKEWTAMADFVAKQHAQILDEIARTNHARQDLALELEAARATLQAMQSKRSTVTKTVAVDLRVERPGTFELKVSYAVPGPTWKPVWDARLDPEQGRVELSLSTLVTQQTGEDWSQVKLAVSTAKPSRPLYVPELFSRYLDKVVAVADHSAGFAMRQGMPSAAPVASRLDEKRSRAEEEASEADLAADSSVLEMPAATLQMGLLSATFSAPRQENIDGSGKPRKVFLSNFQLPAEVERRTAPANDPTAYLTAKVKNDTGIPLLAGAVSVFLGDEYLGQAEVPFTGPSDELKLAFGADDRIKVERKRVERKHETAGVFSKEDVFRYRTRIHVKNLYARKTKVTLLDLVPVSRDESITVKVLEVSTKPNVKEDPSRPGVRTHALSLEPKEERIVELQYEVRTPRGHPVAGLDVM